VAVAAFLDERLDFVGIFDLVEKTVNALPDAASIRSLEDIYAFDGAARSLANEFLAKR
jgi:1-deoxy-D-xylulose 5-phosphate reductoisomerase